MMAGADRAGGDHETVLAAIEVLRRRGNYAVAMSLQEYEDAYMEMFGSPEPETR